MLHHADGVFDDDFVSNDVANQPGQKSDKIKKKKRDIACPPVPVPRSNHIYLLPPPPSNKRIKQPWLSNTPFYPLNTHGTKP